MDSQLPLRRDASKRRAGIAWLAAMLVLPALAAPARAQEVVQSEAGGVKALETSGAPGASLDSPAADGDPLLAQLQELGTTSFVPGSVARLRSDGKAAIPLDAPESVRSLISQYNRIVGKRYRWGGGHGTVEDKAYDCSGAVGYGLIKTGILGEPMVSGDFARWAERGQGSWVTIYANSSHVYTEVAGLRLDTSRYGEDGSARGVRWRPLIGKRKGFKVRHPVGL
jgi:cell wall-associated NlpC family hydrolase